MFDSVASDPERLALIKNLTYFGQDLENKKLPQWMFITPNMTSDGHDTSVTVAGTWTRNFLEPLLTNEYFMKVALKLTSIPGYHPANSNRTLSSLLHSTRTTPILVRTVSLAYSSVALSLKS